MRNNSAIISIYTFCLLLSESIVARETVNYLVLSEMARPFQIEENEMSQGGLITDIIEAVFDQTDYTVNIKVFPVTRLHHEVKTRHVTNWISYDAKAWNSFGEHGEIIDVPLFEVTHDMLTCDSRIDDIVNDDDLEGASIAILENFRYLRLEELANQGRLRLVPVKGYESGILMSNKLRVQGFVEMSLRLKYHVETLGNSDDCQRYVDFSHVIPPYSIYFAVDKHMPSAAKQFVATRLLHMQKNGQLKEIFERWNKY